MAISRQLINALQPSRNLEVNPGRAAFEANQVVPNRTVTPQPNQVPINLPVTPLSQFQDLVRADPSIANQVANIPNVPGVIPNAPTGVPPNVPATGLIGSEQALLQGLGGATGAIQQGSTQARSDITNALGGIQDLLSQTNALGRQDIQQGTQAGLNILQGAFGQGRGDLLAGAQGAVGLLGTGLNQARSDILSGGRGASAALGGALSSGQGAIGRGTQQAQGILGQARTDVNRLFDQGVAPVQGFIAPGQQAQDVNAALSGALGPEAQAQAFQQFQESPGQAFLRDRGEQALLRNQAAIGGLGGGRVRSALAEFGQGIALQDLDRQQQNLANLAGQGLAAAGTAGQLRGQQAGIQGQLGQTGADVSSRGGIASGQLAGQLGAAQADALSRAGIAAGQVGGQLTQAGGNILGQAGITASQLAGQLGQSGAGLSQSGGVDLSRLTSGLGLAGVGEIGRTGTALADIASGQGVNIGNLIAGTGQTLAGGRTRAGELIAGNIGATTNSLADLINQQGAGVSDITGVGAGNLADLLAGGGINLSEQDLARATLLANIASGSGSQVGSLSGIPGVQQTQGILGGLGQAAEGAGSLITALAAPSDERLKENIVKLGQSAGGLNLYTWDWTEEGKLIAGSQPAIGVMAQEVEHIPNAVHTGKDGYLRVNYEVLH